MSPLPPNKGGATATATISDLPSGSNCQRSRYDPLDPLNQGYLGNIGEVNVDPSDANKVVAGLRPFHQVTVQLPLVFWDGARIFFATNGTGELQTAADAGNPIQAAGPWLFQAASPSIVIKPDPDHPTIPVAYSANFNDPATGQGANPDGRVLWYHDNNGNFGGPHGFADDTPGQLTEFTIRDRLQVTWAPNIAEDQLDEILNYDVSYVDQLGLPAMMEATDGHVKTNPELGPKAFAGIGADLSVPQMQQLIAAFTQTTPGTANTVLGQYFGGKGYDKYVFPSSIPNFALLPGGFTASRSRQTPNQPITRWTQRIWRSFASGGMINRVDTGHAYGNGRDGRQHRDHAHSPQCHAKLAAGTIIPIPARGGEGQFFAKGPISRACTRRLIRRQQVVLSTPPFCQQPGDTELRLSVQRTSATGSTSCSPITGIDRTRVNTCDQECGHGPGTPAATRSTP